jgi:hypothetical protein
MADDRMTAGTRATAALVLLLLMMGAGLLWIAIPVGCLWLASKAADSLAQHFLLALPMTIAAMAAWSLALVWLNELYLRVTGVTARMEADAARGWRRRRLRGPLEPLLVGSLVVALVALFVWFFVIAKNPSAQVI